MMKTHLDAANIKRSIYAPMRRKLFRDLFLVIFSTLILLLLFGYYFSLQMKKNLAISILDSTSNQVKANFLHSFSPLLNSIKVNKQWLEVNSMTPDNIDKLNQRFIPLLENSKHISSIIVASSEGQLYFLHQRNKQWMMRNFINKKSKDTIETEQSKLKNDDEKRDLTSWDKKIQQQVVWSKLDNNGKVVNSWEESIDYKMQNRLWYQGALKKQLDNDLFISKPYLFFTQKIPGITLSTTYQPKNNQFKTRYFIAINVSLQDISKTLSELIIGENGKAFLLTSEGAILLPGDESLIYQGNKNKGGFLNLSTKKHHNILFDAVQNWKNNQQTDQPLYFSLNGQHWWSQFFSISDRTSTLKAGIVVPERDFIHVIQRKSAVFLPAAVLISLFSALAAWFIVKNNTKRQKETPKMEFDSKDFKTELYDLLRRGESETLELKSTMRKNLRSGKHGKEIELAWLKGVVAFLNTSGGILLLGIDDEGEMLGLDADEFENDDRIQLHFKNLISQHIGVEFSKYINFFIETVGGKKIIVVECKKSNQPAFLYHKNNETFYIRSGPASVSLSISKALKYIQVHKF